MLFERVFSVPRDQLHDLDAPLDEGDPAVRERMAVMEKLVERRAGGYPLQYLLGEWEFFGLPFYVGEGVLIPRPDTEVVVERALFLLRGKSAPRVLDLCSGSGCIAVAIAQERPDSRVTAVELSEAAFGYLKRNVERHGGAVRPVWGDALDTGIVGGDFALIVSNPPYIRPEAMDSLQREVGYEPRMALEAPERGLYFYREIAARWRERLTPGGILLFEVGFDEAKEVAGILRAAGFTGVRSAKDYGGNDRAVWGHWGEK
ncbi:peptide chain release factor N(5)-glutamine methyltransferase [Oscillospiraceae bacterium NSJ-54]|uniref:peptide chain release factor N(5)-glutamine methyltransferase n=1 Tax=Zongyangia hominis TaxID=2763677 RepID=A0A926EBL1_9FIRM|nr:peptide chain release factor N(5)-glutamine methyltransferase [Zongyangia hominis]